MIDCDKISQRRRAEKRAEFLFEATLRMSEGREVSAMNLLLAAIEVYGADYNAVRTTMENWITNGVPSNVDEFGIMCRQKYEIKS
jgi:hypothetical protein